MENNVNLSPARFFFGFAVFAAIFAFFANAVEFEIFELNSFMFVIGGAIGCCLIACNTRVWNAGVQCFNSNAEYDDADASMFWNNFGSFAWYCGLVGCFICLVTYIGDVRGFGDLSKMVMPMCYCLCYGAVLRAVAYAISCGVGCGKVQGVIGVSGNVGSKSSGGVKSSSGRRKAGASA